ncbi:MAG: preprotein translocase subunit SecA [Bacteroidales bacterium]|jgi:preprotein translocase subunit SecA|nr:preprotein translocase subunit SecA [Bacteroidales bacterium]
MNIVDKFLTKFFGNKSERDIKEIEPVVEEIKKQYLQLVDIDNDSLRAKTIELKASIKEHIKAETEQIKSLKEKAEDDATDIGEKENIYKEIDKIDDSIDNKLKEKLDEILPLAFSIVKETARRFKENEHIDVSANEFDKDLAAKYEYVEIIDEKARYHNSWIAGGTRITWDMLHYDVQLIGGIVLHNGKIAEMATGEGKTLVATLPIFLNALSERGVHIVTVNEYLAKRDSEWMGPIFEFHGLSVDCIDKHEPNSDSRRKAYKADVTYGTNNEFGFDYLRDNMTSNPDELVQRRPNYSIVDEVDSVLIDDARTPLIISGPVSKGDTQLFDELKSEVEMLFNSQKKLTTTLLAEARKKFNDDDKEKAAFLLLQAFKGLPKNKALIKLLSEEGKKSLLHKTENFYMQDNNKNMHKVTDELYFIIDEQNNSIELTDKGHDLIAAKSDDPNLFILPDIGSEISDLENSESSETDKLEKKDKLISEYAIKSEKVHTINQLLKAYTLFEKDDEYVVVDNKVKIVDEQTGRIMDGRRYSDGLHQAIEAKERVKIESATQTFASITLQNYFRMYNKLAGMTGTAETEAGELWDIYELDVVVIPTNEPIVRLDSEDYVYKTTREKYTAVIDEIVKLTNAGRPILVGTTSVEISELLSRMLKIKGIKHNILNAKRHQHEADIVADAGKAKNVTIATNMAGRGTDIKLSKEVIENGGLAIVGTARHESRRVDRQLRGRAGRQGDPGSSQFFVSLEDNLMRLFGSDRIAGIMDKMGLKEGEVIQHGMISKSIERAQKKVEENNFGIRKRLLEYDDVMNAQREIIYKKRKHALYGERLGVDIANMMFDVSESIVNKFSENGDFEGFKMELLRILSIDSPIDEQEFLKADYKKLTDDIYNIVLSTYKHKEKIIAQQAFPVIKNVYKKSGHQYKNIIVPITDGSKTIQVITNLEKTYETEGRELEKSYQKTAILTTIDESWKEHLRELDDFKQWVQAASYEQKDPLLIYKFESFDLFSTMIENVNKNIVSTLVKGYIPVSDPEELKEAQERRKTDYSKYKTSRPDGQSGEENEKKKITQPIRKEKKVGRNDPCPCGSGKKYKNCHGRPGASAE